MCPVLAGGCSPVDVLVVQDECTATKVRPRKAVDTTLACQGKDQQTIERPHLIGRGHVGRGRVR